LCFVLSNVKYITSVWYKHQVKNHFLYSDKITRAYTLTNVCADY